MDVDLGLLGDGPIPRVVGVLSEGVVYQHRLLDLLLVLELLEELLLVG